MLFAGGLITAAVCDHRIAVADGARFGLNEVPIGIPMPAVYVRMLAYAWGEPVVARMCLLGEVFTPAQAHALGMVHELVPAGELLDRPLRSPSGHRGLPRAVHVHQAGLPSRRPARHRRARRPA